MSQSWKKPASRLRRRSGNEGEVKMATRISKMAEKSVGADLAQTMVLRSVETALWTARENFERRSDEQG